MRSIRLILILGYIGLAGIAAWCQQPRPTGLHLSDEKYRQVPILPVYSGKKYNEIPLKVSLRSYCPVPGDQGNTGTCVGWAVGFGALTVSRAVRAGVSDPSRITAMANSAAFLYNQIKIKAEDCSYGAYIEDALMLLKEQGDCLERSFNYNQIKDCQSLPNQVAREEAQQYRVKDFAAVF